MSEPSAEPQEAPAPEVSPSVPSPTDAAPQQVVTSTTAVATSLLENGDPEDTAPQNCDSTTQEVCESTAEKPPASPIPEQSSASDKGSESGESGTPKAPSRELKSILALSKEAKLDTNLTNRRKTVQTPDKNVSPQKKSKPVGFPVTAEAELENAATPPPPPSTPDDSSTPARKNKSGGGSSKKRKSTMAGSNVSTDGATDDSSPIVTRKSAPSFASDLTMLKAGKDVFCWRCHHDKVQITCETCPRAYHQRCLKQTVSDAEHWPCPECVMILKAENTKTRSKAMKGMTLEDLCGLLKFAVKRMIQCNGSEPFQHSVDEKQFPEYSNYIVQPMTLTMLQTNIRENSYGSTQAFEADAKWILHNSIIFNSYQSKLTSAAKTIVKICKQEMAEIENCPSCYRNANTKKHTWFVEVCPKPHLLVWAKLKGFPYWPAKVMSINSQAMADVRFFGAHDKAWVGVKDCYIYSVKDPNSGKQKRNDIIECVKELERYVENLKRIYGRVVFAPLKTPLDADDYDTQLSAFLPNFGKDLKVVQGGDIADVKSSALGSLETAEDDDSSDSDSSEDDDDDDDEEEEELEDTDDEDYCGESDDLLVKRKKRKSESSVHSSSKNDKSSSDATDIPSRIATPFIVAKKNEPVKMIRIDYRVNQEDGGIKTGTSPIKEPIKTIIIRKRPSTDPSSPIASLPVPPLTPTHKIGQGVTLTKITPAAAEKSDKDKKADASTPAAKEQETEDTDKAKKLKMADQLIEKLTSAEEPPAKVEDKMEVDEKSDKTEAVPKVDSDDKAKPAGDKELNDDRIRNIIHSSLVVSPEKSKESDDRSGNSAKKRKLEPDSPSVEKATLIFPPNKMVKLVPIENILKKKEPDTAPPKDNKEPVQAPSVSLKNNSKPKVVPAAKTNSDPPTPTPKTTEKTNKTNVGKANKTGDVTDGEAVKIKDEIESEDENNDVEYMEAKRQYLSALNISEKQKTPLNKSKSTHEIRTRSKTEEKKKNDGATTPIVVPSNAPTVTKSAEPPRELNKEIFVRSLAKMQTPKHRARKSFPTPNYSNVLTRKTVVARKIVPKGGAEGPGEELTVVSSATLQPVASTTATSSMTVLPKLHYINNSGGGGGGTPNGNAASKQPPRLCLLGRPDNAAAVGKGQKAIPEGSQNYIPQGERNKAGGPILNNLLLAGGLVAPPTHIATDEAEPSKSVTMTNPSTSVSSSTSAANNSQVLIVDTDLGALKEILPEALTKNVNDILCQRPPQLKPKPVVAAIVTSEVEHTGVPNSAGPITARVNSISQKLSEYFRSLMVETISDFGKTNNPEATISALKLEMEELKHSHSVELSEMRRNVCIALKDVQKGVIEERDRIISETKANCEAEMAKKVEEAKSKQWCANCLKEAQFYCCWNTSYCDYPCQQKHWTKHMAKCTQNQSQSQPATSTPVRQQSGPQIVLTQASGSKFGSVYNKAQKVYLKRANAPFKQSTGGQGHITLVESTPGNFELLGSGPITVNGKILASTSVIEKIKSGNIVTVTAPSSGSSTTQANQKNSPARIAPKGVSNTSANNANTSSNEH